MKELGTDSGAAPTLAIFLIFVIVSSGLVIAHLQSINERKVYSIQLQVASDFTQSTITSINSELNEALHTATASAMDYVGSKGGTVEDVEDNIIRYLNDRIQRGWDYPNLENIYIPQVNENSIIFDWQPDGSLVVLGYLKSKVEHVRGPAAYGTFLHATSPPRFKRIKYLSEMITEGISDQDMGIEEYEEELNENYECERLRIIIEENLAGVLDLYGGKSALEVD